MRKLLLALVVFTAPVLVGAQEAYGDAKAAKKVLVVRYDTPAKKAVFAEAGKTLGGQGYYVEITTPEAFKAPAAGTLVVYAEGGTKGNPWNDTVRAYLGAQTKGVFYSTFARAGKVFTAPKGVDAITGSSKDNQADTAKKLVDAIKKQL